MYVCEAGICKVCIYVCICIVYDILGDVDRTRYIRGLRMHVCLCVRHVCMFVCV